MSEIVIQVRDKGVTIKVSEVDLKGDIDQLWLKSLRSAVAQLQSNLYPSLIEDDIRARMAALSV
jgi:hypothetical protein